MADPTADPTADPAAAARAVLVEVVDLDADPDELDRLTQALREEILLVDDVDAVRAASAGEAPEGTRGLDIAAVGALVVSVAPTVEALGKILGALRSFLNRPRSAPPPTLRFTVGDQTIELSPTAEQQQALVQEFIRRASS